MDASSFRQVKDAIQNRNFKNEKLDALRSSTSWAPGCFSADQVAELLREFPFDDDKLEVLHICSPRMYSSTCDGVVPIFSVFSFDEKKVKALEIIVGHITDRNVTAFDSVFHFRRDRDRVRDILDKSSPVGPYPGVIPPHQGHHPGHQHYQPYPGVPAYPPGPSYPGMPYPGYAPPPGPTYPGMAPAPSYPTGTVPPSGPCPPCPHPGQYPAPPRPGYDPNDSFRSTMAATQAIGTAMQAVGSMFMPGVPANPPHPPPGGHRYPPPGGYPPAHSGQPPPPPY